MNNPKLPASVQRSTQVGQKLCQLDGTKSRVSEVTKISNRSNHMPMFPHTATTQSSNKLERSFFDQPICGAMTLQKNMMHQLHMYGPKTRLWKVNRSNGLDPYAAAKNSMK